MIDWTDRERRRYDRHFRLAEFGEAAQSRLRRSAALVVGAGGLGCPVLQYLAAAGVGTLGIVDADRVDLSNLQRQTIYTEADVGLLKADRAAAFVRARNADVRTVVFAERLTRHNALDILAPYDVVLDCTDNFAARYLINDACVLADKPLVHGAVHRWEGQLAVFNVPLSDGARSAHYRDLFPAPPAPGVVDDCATAGVLGVLPGIIGALMATEAIKLLAGTGEVQHGKLLLFDATTLAWRGLRIRSGTAPRVERLIDYAAFCGTVAVPTLTAAAALEGEAVHWLDVRTRAEHAAGAVDERWIERREIEQRHTELPTERRLVVYCQSGKRSAAAVRWLRTHRPDLDSYSLEGGYPAYRALQRE